MGSYSGDGTGIVIGPLDVTLIAYIAYSRRLLSELLAQALTLATGARAIFLWRDAYFSGCILPDTNLQAAISYASYATKGNQDLAPRNQ